MKKSIIITLLLFYSFNFLGQKKEIKNSEIDTTKSAFIKLEFFKKILERELSTKELEGIKITDGDTLVFVEDFKDFLKKAKKNKQFFAKERSKAYMPLWQFKKVYKDAIITKEDSLNFQYYEKDTLLLISNKDFYKNRKIVTLPYEPKDSTFLEFYKDIVYLKYSSIKHSEKQRMKLWKEDVKIFITENVHKKVKKELIKFAKYLSKEVDSLNIKFVKTIHESNYLIYGLNTDNDFDYEPRIKPKKINSYYSWNRYQYIYEAKLQIDSREYEKEDDLVLKSKIVFLASLGMLYPTNKLPKENYLSLIPSDQKQFSKTDLEILKYHYSYGICKFTDLKTFEENHTLAKEKLEKGEQMMFSHFYE